MEEAANDGTAAHSTIEKILKKLPYDLDKLSEKARNAVNLFLDWQKKTDFEVIKSESVVYSKAYQYAGTMDCLAKVNGKTCLLDWKTSKGIYPEMELQVVAYMRAAEEMSGERIESATIVRFGKTDAAFEVREIPLKDFDRLFAVFLHTYELWKFLHDNRN